MPVKLFCTGLALGATAATFITFTILNRRKREGAPKKKDTLLDAIGNTPLVYLPTISKMTKCKVYVSTP